MYLEYFGLTERPFSIAPDPHYLYMSSRHKEAMAHLTYGLSQGGCFIVLTGEVGTGKTTLCRNLLEDLPDDVDVALILNANINEQELLQTVCDELKIQYREADSQKQLLDKINAHLLSGFADNRQTVLIIDEAQLLSRDVLEQVRLLTNLETTKSKLLQIILIGQPELNDLLMRNDLRQLAQRVTARYHLGPLERSEIEDYVNFRLGVAGSRKPLFTKQALTRLHTATEGIPRRINVLADHSLLAAYSQNQALVDAKNVNDSTSEVFIKGSKSSSALAKKYKWGAALLGLIMLNGAFWWWFSGSPSGQSVQRPVAVSNEVAVNSAESTPSNDTGLEFNQSSEAGVAGPAVMTTIIRPEGVIPGSVVISDEPLDESELLVQQSLPIEQAPARVFDYDSRSELGRALDASADLTGRISAFRALAAAWDVDLQGRLIRPACDILKDNGVECLGVTSWAQLQRFNRPTILVLDQDNILHRVIVFKLEQDSAQVLVGESVLNVSIDELQSRWTNNGITFWRPSAAGSNFFKQGDVHNQLPALRQTINSGMETLGLSSLNDLESTAFDLSLAQAVFELQTRHGLRADSRVGNETYLLLNEILAPEQTPVLRQRVK